MIAICILRVLFANKPSATNNQSKHQRPTWWISSEQSTLDPFWSPFDVIHQLKTRMLLAPTLRPPGRDGAARAGRPV